MRMASSMPFRRGAEQAARRHAECERARTGQRDEMIGFLDAQFAQLIRRPCADAARSSARIEAELAA